MLTAGASSSATLPAIGASFMGGYFAGIIDTTRGNIIAADAYQTGKRYALIVSPKSLESTVAIAWRTATADVPQAKTRWDGLAATQVLTSATYPAFDYCTGKSYPSDGGSQWYLPALDELELIYRNLKPTTTANVTATRTTIFPPESDLTGQNISSDPAGAEYTTAVPAQTATVAFRDTGTETLRLGYLSSATWSSATQAWVQHTNTGDQRVNVHTNATAAWVRPVRRVLL